MLPDAVIVSPRIAIYGLVAYPLVLYYLWSGEHDRDSSVRQDSCTRQGIFVNKTFGWAKARRQAPLLPHGSYATAM